MNQLYTYQERARELMLDGRSIILQAPTGAGKTRAALTPFLDTFWDAPSAAFPKKCVYVVPMRVLANQFYEEIYAKADKYKRTHRRKLGVARQTGEYKGDSEFRADITFTTIDQVLSSWLMHPYSLSKRKGNLNAGAFVGSYLIFDEFHLFDPDSTLPTTLHMLKMLKGIAPFVLMTATFSAEMLSQLADELDAEPILLDPTDLLDIGSQNKQRYFHTVDQSLVTDDGASVEQIVDAHLSQINGRQRSLVVCNQVERAQLVYKTLKEQPELANVQIRLLHSRFLPKDRQAREQEIQQEFHKDKTKHTHDSMILVGTQVVEVGLDMSCRALHTELAPGAAILQRAGRCARYENEVGHVYVYHVDPKKLAPYHEKEAKKQCSLSWEWLQQHEGTHLDFAEEQELINYAHTPTDRAILDGLQGTAMDWQRQIEALWSGHGSRAEAARLIRQIQSVSVVVHSDPAQLRQTPFALDSFSLHPGTLLSKFKRWQEENECIDPDWDNGRLQWLAQKLIEDEDEEDTQGNRPIHYDFLPIKNEYELFAPLIVLNPALVGYSTELGLTLSPSEPYECDVPQFGEKQTRKQFGYKLESYERHIELVHEAFVGDWRSSVSAKGYVSWLEWITAVGNRLESTYGWQPNIIRDVAELVICLHDVGKLRVGWQDWARAWQANTAIGNPIEPGETAAHTDYDPANAQHQALNKKMRGKRPNHAVESALAAVPLLAAILPDKVRYQPLLRAAFTAICRHHGAFSSQGSSYQLQSGFERHVGNTAVYLPPHLQTHFDPTNIRANFQHTGKNQRRIEETLLIQPTNAQDMTCYMILVRTLRFADQEGTKRGGRE
ncbi:MAG: CRISPR-associated helicase Cas3' [Anaerolineales bacterium]|nr:CRISPR-associated helicase Cas3' [Anaerolineales bacterium]